MTELAVDPIEPGTTILEASAGTGKTYRIASLAAGAVASGQASIEQLLVVTFSREASRELRSRIRSRFTEVAESGLVSPEQEARLRDALRNVERASIMTIHEFCQAMYRSLGILATADPAATLIEDQGPLLREVAEDLYLARYAYLRQGAPFPFHDDDWGGAPVRVGALRIAADAQFDPQAPLVPTEATGAVAERLAFAQAVRDEVLERKRRLGLITFDDQLRRLHDCLVDPTTGPAAGRRIRSRFTVALVDEFQDTDPIQWEILRLIFHDHLPLVLIGDPKQAIYSFRGADVNSYLAASRAADRRSTLPVNHRTDGDLVAALEGLWGGLALGEEIRILPVTAEHPGSRLLGPAADRVPVRLRTVWADSYAEQAQTYGVVIDDLVEQVRQLLTGRVRMSHPGGSRALEPSDLAVLVRTNQTGLAVTNALRTAGIPAAFSGADSIFATASAADWLTVLKAMANPWPGRVRLAMTTAIFGRTDADLARADADTVGDWTATLRRWERVLARHGMAALYAVISGETDFTTRVLSAPDGERRLTDLRHLAQLLHEASVEGQTSAVWLADWLGDAIQHSAGGAERTRRLETDSQAVQILTIHRAKGLQFPIVLLPDLSSQRRPDDQDERLSFHQDGRRVLDLGGREAPDRATRLARHRHEVADDSLRTLYVALTRAQSQVIVWWRRSRSAAGSPLHRLLFRDRALPAPALEYPIDRGPGQADPADLDWLTGLPGVSVERVTPPAAAAPGRGAGVSVTLRLPALGRTIDQTWRRTSYSGLTEGVHADGGRLVIPEAAGLVDDEPAPEDEPPTEATDRSPLADLPGGTQFGSLVHDLLERAEVFVPPGRDRADDLRHRVQQAAQLALPHFPMPGVTADALAEGLLPSLLTPLGPLAADRCLADFPRADRLAELSFEFPMTDRAGLTLGRLADVLEAHLAPDDPLIGYPAELRRPELADQPLRGFLTGSIDAVLRVPDGTHHRYLVVDYKTNRLGGSEQSVVDYQHPALVTAMIEAHYPLQALLYCVALHRFLAARLSDYSAERHLGGVLYLFLRGMVGAAGAETLAPGVFSWAPPPAAVIALSTLLAGGDDQ